MIHAAAQGRPYACFVREDTRIPFMAMPDAIDALLALLDAPGESLTSWSTTSPPSTRAPASWPTWSARPSRGRRSPLRPIARRQAIVDSWPEDVDDARARRDWGFRPAYDLERALREYLVPNIRRRYARELSMARRRRPATGRRRCTAR